MADEIAALHCARHAARRLPPAQPPARIRDPKAIRNALHR
jgi:hypothetical protein